VLVLTDGSGHSGQSRIEATRDVLQVTGARAGPVFGELTDRELYVALLRGDTAPFTQMTRALADVLRPPGCVNGRLLQRTAIPDS
jgi:hypothetical protein